MSSVEVVGLLQQLLCASCRVARSCESSLGGPEAGCGEEQRGMAHIYLFAWTYSAWFCTVCLDLTAREWINGVCLVAAGQVLHC